MLMKLQVLAPALLTLSLGVWSTQSQVQAQATTMPAIPATPLSNQSAPTLPVTVPAPTTSGAPLPGIAAPPNALPPLLLSAPVGAAVEHVVSNTSTINITQLRFAAQPGKKVSATELSKLNTRLDAQKQQMAALFSKSANAVSSKMFMRMLPNDAEGNRVLATTTITTVPVPATPASKGRRATPATTQTVTVTSTQTLSPSGKLLDLKINTSDAKLQKVYDGLDMQSLLGSQGLEGTRLYGLPLALNQPVSQNYTVDVQSVFGNVLGALGTTQSLKARPLNMQVQITRLSDQGREYQQTYRAQPWAMTVHLGEGKDSSQMRLTTDHLTGQITQTYLPSGLLEQSRSIQNLRMGMTIEVPRSPYQMEVMLDITTKTTISPK